MARTTTTTNPRGNAKRPILKHPRDKEQTAFGAAPTTEEQRETATEWIRRGVEDGTLGPIDGWDPADTFDGYLDILGLNSRPMASTKTTEINNKRIANLGS